MKVLIVAPSWIGDTIMAQPLFARLRARFPGAQIDALAPAWVAPVLARMPEISDVIDSPFAHGQLSLKSRWRLARQLAARGYARAYVLPNSLKSALVPFLAGIPVRVGFTGEARVGLVNVRHTLDKAALPLMVERFAQLATEPGGALSRPVAFPLLSSEPSRQQAVLAAFDLGAERGGRLIVCCPGAEYGEAKRWPAPHFAELVQRFAAEGDRVCLLGSPKDALVADEIVALSGGQAVSLCGRTSLGQAVDLLAAADLVVCNDSGLMHVAAAVNTPLVALYGSSSPGFTPPLSDQATVLSLGLTCSPCFKRSCPLGHLDCLNKLLPDQVFAACQQRLSSSCSEGCE